MDLLLTARWGLCMTFRACCWPFRVTRNALSDCSGTIVDFVNLIPRIPGIGSVWAEVYDRKQWPGFWHERGNDGELHILWLGIRWHISSWEVLKKNCRTSPQT
jgi:hypothetical protein